MNEVPRRIGDGRADRAGAHPRAEQERSRALMQRRRFRFAGALFLAAVLPWSLRGTLLPGRLTEPASVNALVANILAIGIATWMRLSIETYPGNRRAYIILPSILMGHGALLVWFVLTRFPYDRVALGLGIIFHIIWQFTLYVSAERNARRRFAVVPFGAVGGLKAIRGVDWLTLARPRLHDARACHAIVADFSADLPDEWEAFLADAALAGRIVYQVKQLGESLTGRVELQHLSENSFGSLLPARGYFHLKGLIDFLFALAVLPAVALITAAVGIAIRLEGPGPILFRQTRVGHSGKRITIYKFRTMRPVDLADERAAAMTGDDDDRITRVGKVLRKLRIDELPQIINILKWEMSWIGPRPEAAVLSVWYTSEIPFYRYRHVVKPGISGWAQVNQGHVAEVEQVHRKLQYDFYYIKYFSPWLDVLIVFRTIKTMLTGFGSR
ncbi:sugar transferase [Sphingomonas sp.]|uniref:sugar transferase n=1 Tax=Sphingomonas sp. TaxID=28214 RepID=UPI0025F136F1|nr:sugar transferase [Sphingomonas sp.]MBV9527565.1 sugar transferase [Sphingomonas sp.]